VNKVNVEKVLQDPFASQPIFANVEKVLAENQEKPMNWNDFSKYLLSN